MSDWLLRPPGGGQVIVVWEEGEVGSGRVGERGEDSECGEGAGEEDNGSDDQDGGEKAGGRGREERL